MNPATPWWLGTTKRFVQMNLRENDVGADPAEYVALWFKQAGIESGFYWYVSAILAVTTVGFMLLPETKKHSLILED